LGLVTIFYCLRFETSLFVTSYDSQGHGGGIPPHLHTGNSIVRFSLYSLGSDHSTENIRCLAMDICDPALKTLLATSVLLLRACIADVAEKWAHSIIGCVFVAGLFTESFPNNGSTCHFIVVYELLTVLKML
jgi:hypothetical protein